MTIAYHLLAGVAFATLLPAAAALAQDQSQTSPYPPQTPPAEEVAELEEIFVVSTRSRRRVQDEPVRIEVLNEEEIAEKLIMRPGNISMILAETGGVRVQVTSPGLGSANVRVQGMRGRYTQLLADGLPLYGGQSSSLGLLQIPPSDLGQVEVIRAPPQLYTADRLWAAWSI
ncbi:TonB-dependent receptor plug domain-containing protein [Brevundimonas aurantiaca]|uniref:TonB-dependent receptor plug domain-containing protein n=1 Tax=Brevundimonas aurantiaca TaxID=74316 RepID=UPI00191AA830|nr:Plug domain-containing protein [Brevundimonas aurantiaca]